MKCSLCHKIGHRCDNKKFHPIKNNIVNDINTNISIPIISSFTNIISDEIINKLYLNFIKCIKGLNCCFIFYIYS